MDRRGRSLRPADFAIKACQLRMSGKVIVMRLQMPPVEKSRRSRRLKSRGGRPSCCATGNVFRPTKSHPGQSTTQRESVDRSDQPNTRNLWLSAAVWKPLPASREPKDGN